MLPAKAGKRTNLDMVRKAAVFDGIEAEMRSWSWTIAIGRLIAGEWVQRVIARLHQEIAGFDVPSERADGFQCNPERIRKMTKANLKSSTAAAPKSSEKEEFDGTAYVFHMVEVTGGKKVPVGTKSECIQAKVGPYGPFCRIVVEDREICVDAKHIKVLKPLAPARLAVLKAETDAAAEAVLIVSGIVKNETEKAVLIAHSGWFKARWFPKSFVTKLGEHDDAEQSLYEVPTWKVRADMGPDAVKALEGMQATFEAMLAPKAVPGKTTVIKGRKAK